MKALSQLVFTSEGFAFNSVTGESYTINPCGKIVVDLLSSGKDVEQTARTIAEHFGISLEKAFADVLEFRGQLRMYRLEEQS